MSVRMQSPAREALARGDMVAVRRLAEAMMTRTVGDCEGPFLLGLAEAVAGRIGAAVAHVESAIAIAPRGEYRAQLARMLILARRDAEAAAGLAAVEAALP